MISKIDCRLYIEGCQIPFNTVTISAQVNQSSVCTIEVAPSEFVRKLLPRSHILVVFLEDKVWRVLWDGELRGFGMTKSSTGVAMQITAMDYSNCFGFMTRSIVDNVTAQTSTYAMFHTGAEFTFSAAGGATFADSVTKTFESKTDKFSELINNLIKSTYQNIPYFSFYNTKNKVLERLVSLKDENVIDLLRNSVATDFMSGIIRNRFIGNVSFDQILNYFLEIAGYIRIPMIAPYKYNGTSPIMLMKPNAYFSTPPVSNCFFPDMYQTISGLGIDYLTEPTRIILTAQETPTFSGEPGYTPLWFFNETGPQNQVYRTNAELMNSFLSQDEINKGIFPYQKSISYEQTINIKRGGEDFESMKRSMQGFAYYEYVKAKFAHRTCQLSCIFHPYAIVGFPGAIFEANQSMFGMIDSVSHVISADGSAGTQISFSHIYPADRSDINNLFTPPIPKWVSSKYRPRGCDATYTELFGKNSSGHAALGGDKVKTVKKTSVNPTNDKKFIYDDDQVNIADIASAIFMIPKKAGEATSITKEDNPMYSGENANAQTAYDYTRREVISLSEYMKAMNIGNKTDAELIDPPTLLSDNADIYQHPVSFIYDGTNYVASGQLIARRQTFAKLLQADLIDVTGKLGK